MPIVDRMRANLRALRGTDFGMLAEQPADTTGLCQGIRWWRGSTLDLVRTAEGTAWLFFPVKHSAHPPLFGSMYRNAAGSVIEYLAENGGAVVPYELPLGKALELRLVGTKP